MERGYNDSVVHTDFMIGGPEVRWTGSRRAAPVRSSRGNEWVPG